jgi:hypothetical protein
VAFQQYDGLCLIEELRERESKIFTQSRARLSAGAEEIHYGALKLDRLLEQLIVPCLCITRVERGSKASAQLRLALIIFLGQM